MPKNLQVRYEKLEEQKIKLREKEKALKIIEKQKIMRSFSGIGKIAKKANLPSIDDEALFGAFLEIAEKSKDPENLKKWQNISEAHRANIEKNNGSPVVIKFSKHPEKDVRDEIRSLGLKWNAFRGEFYGYGSSKKLKDKFESHGATIEVVN